MASVAAGATTVTPPSSDPPVVVVVVGSVVVVGGPVVVAAVVKALRGIKSLANELKGAFNDLAKESGVEEVTKELDAEMRYIRGDDGKLYESYDIAHKIPSPSQGEDKGGGVNAS